MERKNKISHPTFRCHFVFIEEYFISQIVTKMTAKTGIATRVEIKSKPSAPTANANQQRQRFLFSMIVTADQNKMLLKARRNGSRICDAPSNSDSGYSIKIQVAIRLTFVLNKRFTKA